MSARFQSTFLGSIGLLAVVCLQALGQSSNPAAISPKKEIAVQVQESPSGDMMCGQAVNSDAGLTGSIVVNERNFNVQKHGQTTNFVTRVYSVADLVIPFENSPKPMTAMLPQFQNPAVEQAQYSGSSRWKNVASPMPATIGPELLPMPMPKFVTPPSYPVAGFVNGYVPALVAGPSMPPSPLKENRVSVGAGLRIDVPMLGQAPCCTELAPCCANSAPCCATPVACTAPCVTQATSPAAQKTMEKELVKLITDMVAPQSWSLVGGQGAVDYFPLGMALVVHQTPEVHEQIAELLNSLRRLQDVQVAVEVRFISVPDLPCERVGVDFNINLPNIATTGSAAQQRQVHADTPPNSWLDYCLSDEALQAVFWQVQPFGFMKYVPDFVLDYLYDCADCLLDQNSSDPNQRMDELMKNSEDLRQISHEWERIWFNDKPSSLTPPSCPQPCPACPAMAQFTCPGLNQVSFVPQVGGQQCVPFGCINGFTPVSSGTAGVSFLNDCQVMQILQAVQAERRTNIMQAPKLTMFNGQPAIINVCEQHRFAKDVEVSRIGGQVSFSPPQIETVTTGLQISLQPVVSADRRFVKLKLNIEDTSLTPGTMSATSVTTVPGCTSSCPSHPQAFIQCAQRPQVERHTVEKTLVIPDGGSALFCGWVEQGNKNQEAAPVLSKVPYVGRLFANEALGAKTVLIMVTPRVINDGAETAPAPTNTGDEVKQAKYESVGEVSSHEPLTAEKVEYKVTHVTLPSPAINKGTQEGVAKVLVEMYNEACAEGRLDDAQRYAGKALKLDPACFCKQKTVSKEVSVIHVPTKDHALETTAHNRVFIRAGCVKYDELKDQMIVEGTDAKPALLEMQDVKGGQRKQISARKIFYSPRTGEFHGEGIGEIDFIK